MHAYWLDVFEEKPLEAHRNEDGFIQLKDTGDSLIDKWEEKIAAGEEPDLSEAFSPEAWESLHRMRAKAAKMDMAMKGMTMKEAMERVNRQAEAEGLETPAPHQPRRIRTFGDFDE